MGAAKAALYIQCARVCAVTIHCRPKHLLNFQLAYVGLMTLNLTIVQGIHVVIFYSSRAFIRSIRRSEEEYMRSV